MISNLKENNDGRVEKLQLLLENPEQKKLLDLANMISPMNQFRRDQTALGEKIVKDKLKAKFNVAFKLDEIRRECQRYNLTLLPARKYEGEYSEDYLEKLQAFFTAKQIAISPDDYTTLLYVLAPAKGDCDTAKIKYPCKDPLVFWKMPEDYYVLVDGDRNYINPLNLWLGLKNRNQYGARITYGVEYLALQFIILFTCSWYWKLNLSLWWTLALLVSSVIGQFIRMYFRASHNGSDCDHYKSYFNESKFPVCSDKYIH